MKIVKELKSGTTQSRSRLYVGKDGRIHLGHEPELLYIDLFCGAGGVSSGIVRAGGKVLMCINHDPVAIASHEANHPDVIHAVEDITTFDLTELVGMVEKIRKENPNVIICLWASLECTHFSKAKGGDHRDADSRTLAEHLYRYIDAIDPEYIDIENVVEFMSWGPLRIASEKMHKDRCDLKARKDGGYHMVPFSRKNGKYYHQWHRTICRDYGYEYDYRILDSADFGALTSRKRYFGQFRKPMLPFTWPVPTHAKNPEKVGMFGGLKPWKAVKSALDLEDEGKSIFGRKKELSENTLKRIYAGLVKYVGEGKEPEFIMKYLSNSPKSGVSNPVDLEGVAPTITTQNRLAYVNAEFITKYFGGNYHNKSTDGPLDTITTKDHHAVVFPSFLTKYHGTGENILSTDSPCSTLSTKDRLALVQSVWLDKQFRSDANHQSIDRPAGSIMTNEKHCKMTACFIMNQFSGGGQHAAVDSPLGAITTVPKSNLIQTEGFLFNHNYENTGSSLDKPSPTLLASRKHFYLLNPQYQSKGNDLDRPCFTLIARMDKMPPYLVDATEGVGAILIYEEDSEIMKKIKLFMAYHGIIDIKMRMLKVPELLRIQGFGDGYILKGTQTDQKRFIGNAVEVNLAKHKVKARIQMLSELVRKEAVA